MLWDEFQQACVPSTSGPTVPVDSRTGWDPWDLLHQHEDRDRGWGGWDDRGWGGGGWGGRDWDERRRRHHYWAGLGDDSRSGWGGVGTLALVVGALVIGYGIFAGASQSRAALRGARRAFFAEGQ
jgi:hypothetical protein